MALAEDTISPAQKALARFQADSSSQGRLAQYSRSRIAGFWLRQTLTVAGSVTLGWFEAPWFGLTLAVLALVGETFDLAMLRLLQGALHRQPQSRKAARLAVLGAGVQGLTIAGCVALTWRLIPLVEAQAFAVAFLISAMINAGLTRSLFRAASDLRIVIFMATGAAMLGVDFRLNGFVASIAFGYKVASFCLLCYISILLVRLVERNQSQRRRNELALLTQQVTQERAARALQAAHEENKRLALVAEHASDSIVIGDSRGHIQWVNDAFTRITGFSADEALGRLPGELLNHPDTDPDTVAKIEAARRDHAPVRVEILNRTKSGQSIWLETSLIPVRDKDDRPEAWIAVERDISRAKQREAELARARIAAEEAGQAKSLFLANMSHEIRTPMNGVIGVAELLSETDLTPTQSGYVETILDSGRSLLALINDILDLAKLQSGKTELERRAFSPRDMITNCLRVLAPVAAKKGLELRLESEDADLLVLGDEGKLRQVVLNLLGNALKFTREGSVTIRLRLPGVEGALLAIEVEDTGIGIAPERLGAIFESFSQADAGIGRQFGGTGLGLTICAKLAEQMGGRVTVRSESGKGSTFTFQASLPLAKAQDRAARQFELRSDVTLRAGLRILVAEDNRTNMMIVRSMLQAHVQAMAEAQDGAEAIAIYRDQHPDLILMDVAMPVKDGLQATREIREIEAKEGRMPCPIIALTANAFGEDREACLQAGMNGFLTKPLSRNDLLAAIAEQCPDEPSAARVIGL